MLDVSKYPRFASDARLLKKLAFLEMQWRNNCPDVNLEKQLGWAHYWIQTRGKGYTDMNRFLSNWFKKCQEMIDEKRGDDRRVSDRRQVFLYKEEKPADEEIMTAEDFKRMRSAL